MAPDVRATIAGFLGALVVLGALAWLVGLGDLLEALSVADPPIVAAVFAAAAVWLSAWALGLRVVLGSLGADVSRLQALVIYTGAMFANNVTPFGQAGGEPVSALLISETTGTEYETGLAAIASADALNFVPSTAFAFLGVSYFSVVVAVGGRLLLVTVAVVGLVVLLPVIAYVVWTNRDRLEAAVARVLTPLARTIGRHVPRLEPPTVEAVERRIDGFFREIEVVATDRRALLTALGFSALGWFAQATALWLSLHAVDFPASFPAVLVAVPLGAVASVTPLPGGLGGIETALVGLLVLLTPVSPATAAAAVVIHRSAIYWLPTLAGAGVFSALGVQRL